MKKITTVFFSMLLLLLTAACGNEQSLENTASPAAESQTDADESAPAAESSAEAEQSAVSDGNILIAYFSVPETDGVDTVAGLWWTAKYWATINTLRSLFSRRRAENCSALKPCRSIREAMIRFWNLPTMKKRMTQGRNFPLILKTWRATTPFSSATLTGTRIFQCRCTHFWRNMISAERQSFRSQHMEAADFPEQSVQFRNYSRMHL